MVAAVKNISRKLSLRIMGASAIGTLLEWYDFSLFAFLTPLLATLFFPKEDTFTALMFTYTIFAIGFLVRPLGAIIFGHLGDRIGRKKTLVISILLMSIATFLMGVLPTYDTLGIWAPILLIILRICQGLSVGGESTGAVLFVIETNHYQRRGFVCSTLWAVIGVGMLLGSLASTIVSHYPATSYAWRVPFLLGIFTGIIGYVVRKRIPEPLLFQEILDQGRIAHFPLWEGIKKYKKEMFIIIGLYLLSAMITYLNFIFMPAYAADIIGMALADTTLVSTIALAAMTLLVPIGGYLSDVFGRKPCLILATSCFIVASYPLYHLIATGVFHYFIVAEIILVLFSALFQGTVTAAVIEQLPTSVRYSVMAVGYSISYSLFGGTAPLVAGYLATLTGNVAAPGWYLTAGACIALLAAIKMRETFKANLSD